MPGYSAERYRQNPPAIGCVLKYYSKEDTDAIVEVFKRVGRTHFSYPDVSDLLPNYMAIRRMKTDGILEMVLRRHNYVPSTWKFKPELAYRIEKALEKITMADTKICPKCKQEKELSEYYSDRHGKDGITYLCKSCHAEYRRNAHRTNKTKDPSLKQCNRCGMLKPLEEFYKSKYERDGYQRWCKMCKTTAVKTVCESEPPMR